MKRFIIAISLMLFAQVFANAQSTTVYVVRHAEKDMTNPSNPDPSLSGEGLQRSFDLRDILAKEKIDAVFSTNYKRTIQTGNPLSMLINKEIIMYDPSKNQELIKTILENHKGKKVLIVGHSNTILTLIKAFGATPSTEQLQDTQYNLLFELKISPQKTTLTERTYGR